MPGLVCAHELRKTFGAVAAVDGLSFEVQAGEIYGLVGPDGSGKTTTIRLLCGALRCDSGEVSVAGFPMRTRPEQARAHIGYLPQRFSLYDELTVLENLRFIAGVRGVGERDWKARSLEILKFVGLDGFTGRRAGQLSGGMRQKLSLAAALVHRPQVLLLDEPTTGVDPVTRQDFWQLIIQQVSREGVAAVVSTPYMDEAARCSRVGFLRRGRLLEQGKPEELRRKLDGRILEGRGQPLQLLRRLAGELEAVEDVQMFGDRLHIRLARSEQALSIEKELGPIFLAAGGIGFAARVIPPLLEDVFISLVEGYGQG